MNYRFRRNACNLSRYLFFVSDIKISVCGADNLEPRMIGAQGEICAQLPSSARD